MRYPKFVGFRDTTENVEKIDTLAIKKGVDRSDIIRGFVRECLEKKLEA